MSNQQGSDSNAAQLEKDHKNFVKSLEGKLKENKFTKKQTEEILELANKAKPGNVEAIAAVMNLYEKYNKANHEPEAPIASESPSELDEDFVVFAQATGQLRSDTGVNKLTDDEIVKLGPLQKQWIKAGKPEAINPLEDEEPERIIRVSRRREFGKQFLTYIVSGESIPRGIELIPTYRKYKLNNQLVVDKTTIVSTKAKYTIPFTKGAAQELVDRCVAESETPSFTFKQGGKTITIRIPENFVADFDNVIKQAAKGDPV